MVLGGADLAPPCVILFQVLLSVTAVEQYTVAKVHTYYHIPTQIQITVNATEAETGYFFSNLCTLRGDSKSFYQL